MLTCSDVSSVSVPVPEITVDIVPFSAVPDTTCLSAYTASVSEFRRGSDAITAATAITRHAGRIQPPFFFFFTSSSSSGPSFGSAISRCAPADDFFLIRIYKNRQLPPPSRQTIKIGSHALRTRDKKLFPPLKGCWPFNEKSSVLPPGKLNPPSGIEKSSGMENCPLGVSPLPLKEGIEDGSNSEKSIAPAAGVRARFNKSAINMSIKNTMRMMQTIPLLFLEEDIAFLFIGLFTSI